MGPFSNTISSRHRIAPLVGVAVGLALGCGPGVVGGSTLLEPRQIIWGYSSGASFNSPRGIAFDPSDGAIYVANTGEHRIEVFSKTGRALSRFVHQVTRPDGTIADGSPCALAFDRAGRLLVADQLASYVDVLDRRGHPVTRLAIPAGHVNALAVGPDGTIYVGTNSEVSKVYRFRANYAPDGSWGEEGTEPGHLFGVNALAVVGDTAIAVVCGRTDLAVQIFTLDGTYLRGFGRHDVGEGNVSLPSGVVATADGRIWVADEIRESIQVFDKDGSFIAKTGEQGVAPGEFGHPSSLTSNGRGLIALTDRGFGRVQVLAIRDGQEGVSAGQ
jgi:DNA-binding beta-propeller fold protein YncE